MCADSTIPAQFRLCSLTQFRLLSLCMGDFRDLKAWQEAIELIKASKVCIEQLPATERFALADQWRRASYSVALNIAEGASRRGPREFRRFLDIALSSLHEIEGIIVIVASLDYLSVENLRPVTISRASCARLVFGLIRRLRGS